MSSNSLSMLVEGPMLRRAEANEGTQVRESERLVLTRRDCVTEAIVEWLLGRKRPGRRPQVFWHAEGSEVLSDMRWERFPQQV